MPFLWISFLFIFLPIFLFIYYLCPPKRRNVVLVIGSLLFYLWGNPTFFLILVFLSAIVYLFGYLIDRYPYPHPMRLGFTVASILICVSVLLGFHLTKYLVSWIFYKTSSQSIPFFIPLGLFYYILSMISYTIDIYRLKAKREINFFRYMTYITLFPKLLAGPVVIYHKFQSQIPQPEVTFQDITAGVRLFILGLGKKVLLADNVILLWQSVHTQNLSGLTTVNAWLGAFSILFAIYFDCAGYTDMARGLARLLGFTLPINLRYPLVSRSMLEFCSRFQISLFHWLRYYVRLPERLPISPLSRFSISAALIALCYSASCGWNPPAMIAILFAYCLLLVQKVIPRKTWLKIPKFLRTCLNFFLLLLIVSIFSQTQIGDSISYLQTMFGLHATFADPSALYYLSTYLILLITCLFIANQFVCNRLRHLQEMLPKAYAVLRPMGQACTLFFSIAYLINTSSHSFLCILS